MAKKQKEITTVKLDCKSPAQQGIKLSKEHAENLLNLQVAKGYDHYSLSEGQGLIFKDGKITHDSGDTGESQG